MNAQPETTLADSEPTGPATDNSLLLPGLDGTNPLGFLAALGVLKSVQTARQEANIRMKWIKHAGTWIPALNVTVSLDELASMIADTLHLGDPDVAQHKFLTLGKNLGVDPAEFTAASREACDSASLHDRRQTDFLASFGCGATTHDKLPRILPTDLHFISGSGHQHFLETAGKLFDIVTWNHLLEAISGPWLYRDERLSFRWDPSDAREHAYQWTAPGDETTTTIWGANLLAFEGMSFLSTAPSSSRLQTMCFSRISHQTAFRWPIWAIPINQRTIQSMLCLDTLHTTEPNLDQLAARGISALYQSEKVKIGQGANFKWSFTPARRIA